MTKPLVYLICGVSGSGKSWVCASLKREAKYIPYDKTNKKQALTIMGTATVPILYDPVTNISTFIKRNKDYLDIKLIIITGDFLKVKERLLARGGKITKSLYSRWKRMLKLSESAIYSGSSEDVVKFLKQQLKRNYSIYKAISPSGKVYIGKTSGSLSARISAHMHDALVRKKEYLFSKAIRKYGKAIAWEIIVDNVNSYEQINFLEKTYIAQYKSNVSEFGYNLTDGGDGGQLVGDSYLKKSASLKRYYSSSKGIALKAKLSKSSRAMRANNALLNDKIRAIRGTDISRAKTSADSKKRYESKEAREKMSTILTNVYKDTNVRKKISDAVREARAKPFTVFAPDGTIAGTWSNSSSCAESLGIDRGGISACLNGHRGSVKGYKFKWN